MATSYTPDAPPTRRRSPLRWALPVLLALAGLGLLAYGVPALNGTWTAQPVSVTSGDTVASESGGFSVYARADLPRRDTVCTATRDGRTVTLSRPVAQSVHRMKGERFYEVARTPSDLSRGSYTLACTGTSEQLSVGARGDDVVGALRRAELLTPLGAACLLAAGMTALLLLLASRHEQRTAGPRPTTETLPPGPFRSPMQMPMPGPLPSPVRGPAYQAAQGYPSAPPAPYAAPLPATDPLDDEPPSTSYRRPTIVTPGPLPAPTRAGYQVAEQPTWGEAPHPDDDATLLTTEPPTIVAPGPLPAPPARRD